MINIEDSMKNLSPQQRQEADQLFSRALQCAKNNDMVGAANYYRQSADKVKQGLERYGKSKNKKNVAFLTNNLNKLIKEAQELVDSINKSE
ncbi:MAG: hypothetical protein GYA02_03370 [Clostridiaceae bacterium]|nr:hypothetical protein [Clostridiaceae bacterium]